MEGKGIEISLPSIREQVIWTFFKMVKSYYGIIGTFGKCKTGSEDIFLENKKNHILHEHLKSHPLQWNLYLSKLAHAIKPDLPNEFDALKLATLIVDLDTDTEYLLTLPLSRLSRDPSNLKVSEAFNGLDGRIQTEYNSSPVGPYMGSFDQSEDLRLDIQLPDSNLDFDGYTQFRHPNNVPCNTYSIKDSYKKFAELNKIDAEIAEDDETYVDYDESQLHYTCQGRVSVLITE